MYDPAYSEFAGLLLLLFVLPWSWIFRDANPRILADQYNNKLLVGTTFVVLNTVSLAGALIVFQKITSRTNTSTSNTAAPRPPALDTAGAQLSLHLHHWYYALMRQKTGPVRDSSFQAVRSSLAAV
jgi:hypothetical protein